MTPASKPIDHIVIFGATGDLAARMLLPSLYFLDVDGLLPEGLKIIGSARTKMDRAAYAKRVHDGLKARPEGLDAEVWKRFAARLDYCAADVSGKNGLGDLAKLIGEDAATIFYLALSPTVYAAACEG